MPFCWRFRPDVLARGSRPPLRRPGIAGGNGALAEQLLPLGTIYSSPGVFDEIIHLFAATGISQGEAAPEDDEDIEVVRMPFAEALALAAEGESATPKP